MPFETPLKEAVAEVDFAAQGLVEFRSISLQRALRDKYPVFERLPLVLLPLEQGGQQFPPYSSAVRFFSENRKCLVQYGPRVLSFNELDYPGWDAFKEKFMDVFRIFGQLEPPELIERFHLEYVNRIPALTPKDLQSRLTLDLNVTDNTIRNEFAYRRVEQHDFFVTSVAIAPIGPDQFSPEPCFSVTCAANSFGLIQFDTEGLDIVLDRFEKSHQIVKDLFWSLLTLQTQKEWEETHAQQSA